MKPRLCNHGKLSSDSCNCRLKFLVLFPETSVLWRFVRCALAAPWRKMFYIGFCSLIDRGDAVNDTQSKTHCMTCQLLHTYCSRFNLSLCPSMPYFNPLGLRSYLSLFLKQISSRCLHWVPVSYSIPWWCDASDLFWRCGNRDVVASSRRGLSSLSSQTIGAHRKIS